MAEIVITDQRALAESWRTWVRTIIVGAVLGLAFWVLTVLIGRYIIEPMACRQVMNAVLCTNATEASGNVAAVLAAVIGVIALVRIGATRPIVTAVASAALLWQLAAWTTGLAWFETALWSTLLWAMTFGLFAWITRYATLVIALVLSFLVVIIIRIALVL